MKITAPHYFKSTAVFMPVTIILAGLSVLAANPTVHSAVSSVFSDLILSKPTPEQEVQPSNPPEEINPTIMPIEPLPQELYTVPPDKKRPATSITLNGKEVNPENKPAGKVQDDGTEVTWTSEQNENNQVVESNIAAQSTHTEQSSNNGTTSTTRIQNNVRVQSETNGTNSTDGDVKVNFEIRNNVP